MILRLFFRSRQWALCLAFVVGIEQVTAECDSSVNSTTPTSRFEFPAQESGTLADRYTGLIWMRCPAGANWSEVDQSCQGDGSLQALFSWTQALVYAESQPAQAGRSKWRLANKKELASIVEYQCRLPALNTTLFPNLNEPLSETRYWTSTPLVYFSQPSVWAVNFSDGEFLNVAPAELLRVRLVRDQ
jgi:hypothetical protein